MERKLFKQRLDVAVQRFILTVQNKFIDDYGLNHPNLPIPTVSFKSTSKYILITNKWLTGATIFVFIDKKTGNIYRPISWRKHEEVPCANIFDEASGACYISIMGNHCKIDER